MPLTPGHMLQNRYRIVALLGQGGMGAVYRAWDIRLKKPIALKEMVPQPGLDAETLTQYRKQFEQEAVTLGKLKHQHLVPVTDYFEENGSDYLAMEFVEGESLADRINREGALPEEQVVIWAKQLLDALAYCHKQRVLHRDIKPQNVIITPDGDAILVDFGLVKLWDPADPQTRTVMRGMGTPEYAPPEQWSALGYHTDPRSDLYSLGATLYHALTGQAPLTASDRMAYPKQFKTPRELTGRVSEVVDIAITRSIALICDDRWSNAESMTQALTVVANIPDAAMSPLEPIPSKTQLISESLEPTQPKQGGAPRRWLLILGLVAVVTFLACVVPVGLMLVFPDMGPEWGTVLVMGLPGIFFLIVYLATGRKLWWPIILGGSLITFAITAVESIRSPETSSIALVLLLGIGLTFILTYTLSTSRRRMWWALIPAAIFCAIGVLGLLVEGLYVFLIMTVIVILIVILIAGYDILQKLLK